MEGKWERIGTALLQWLVVPAVVFGFGYFVIGPLLSGGAGQARSSQSNQPAIEQPPIQPGPRKWNPVSPPQVDLTITPKEDPLDEFVPEEDPIEEPPVDETDDGSTGDEGSVGGMSAPPVKKEETTTGGTTGTFKGITGGGW
jgi:hypothetical protein